MQFAGTIVAFQKLMALHIKGRFVPNGNDKALYA